MSKPGRDGTAHIMNADEAYVANNHCASVGVHPALIPVPTASVLAKPRHEHGPEESPVNNLDRCNFSMPNADVEPDISTRQVQFRYAEWRRCAPRRKSDVPCSTAS